jgi:hypothetical protein
MMIAVVNLRRDPSQRSVLHLWNWLARFFIGALWWQQSLWKLPPTYTDNPDGSGGLRYWMGEMAKWVSTGLQRHFVCFRISTSSHRCRERRQSEFLQVRFKCSVERFRLRGVDGGRRQGGNCDEVAERIQRDHFNPGGFLALHGML